MRAMVIVKATESSESGATARSGDCSVQNGRSSTRNLVKAGIMLAGEGLKPSSKGKRVSFPETKSHGY